MICEFVPSASHQLGETKTGEHCDKQHLPLKKLAQEVQFYTHHGTSADAIITVLASISLLA